MQRLLGSIHDLDGDGWVQRADGKAVAGPAAGGEIVGDMLSPNPWPWVTQAARQGGALPEPLAVGRCRRHVREVPSPNP